MRYSQSESYMRYFESKASGDLEAALHHIKKTLSEAEDPIQRADLLQRIGELIFDLGDSVTAITYFDQSEKCDSESLLMSFYYAKFLVERMGLVKEATEKCDAIIASAQQRPFPRTEGDYSSEEYREMAQALKERCLVKEQNDGAKAEVVAADRD